MKIGIITFWDSHDNYGQIMQCYALSTYLEKAGHNTVIIRYKPYQKEGRLARLKKLNPTHVIAYYKYRKEQKTLQQVKGVTRDFDGFRNKNLRYTDKVYNGFEQLWHEDWSSFDAFVCGSDQIWSPKPDEQLNAYFLQFAPYKCLRIAYAPSFGRSVLPEYYQAQLHNLLEHFDAISVREREGVAFCKHANFDSQLVCDPTLLLKDSDYKKLTNHHVRDNKVFCYLIKWDTLFPIDEVKRVVSKYEGIHYFCTNGQEQFFQYEKNQTIENWVESIQKSNLSLTNSFHGTVFSILSHTPFVAFPLTGEASAMNNRLTSLLTKLGLEDRIYSKGTDLNSIVEAPIDWDKVDARLNAFRIESEKFLLNALKKKDQSCEHNICFLTSGSVHHNYGGLDRVTELLAGYFKSKGANVYFVSQKQREVIHEDIQHFLPNAEKYNTDENVKWLNDFIEQNHIDVVINQEGNVDITLPIKSGVKRITVLHFNPNYIDDNYFINKFKTTPLLKYAFKTPVGKIGLKHLRNKLARNYIRQIQWADSFVMLSDLFRPTLSQLLSNGYDYRKILAVNNPLVLDSTFGVSKIKKEKTILYVGRIDNGFKNVDKLIHIWGKIADKLPDWNFEICGQGQEYESNKQLVERKNIPRCKLLGLVDPTDYYKKASVIMMASSASEGWGMVLVEAMQYGCVPIVLNSYAAVKDIVHDGDNGVVVEPCKDMEKSFAQQLLKLLQSDSERKQMMVKAIESVKQYDINNIGQQWLKLINEK